MWIYFTCMAGTRGPVDGNGTLGFSIADFRFPIGVTGALFSIGKRKSANRKSKKVFHRLGLAIQP